MPSVQRGVGRCCILEGPEANPTGRVIPTRSIWPWLPPAKSKLFIIIVVIITWPSEKPSQKNYSDITVIWVSDWSEMDNIGIMFFYRLRTVTSSSKF